MDEQDTPPPPTSPPAGAMPPPEKVKIRPIRNDLHLLPGGRDSKGSPTWIIHDMPANKFFKIGWLEFEILSRWHMNDPDAILQDIWTKTTLRPEESAIRSLLNFLQHCDLLIPQTAEEREKLKKRYIKDKEISVYKLLKTYLFFKIPLARPDRFLEWFSPRIEFLFTKQAFFVILALAAFSLYIVTSQWSMFIHTFIYFFTFEGLIVSSLAVFMTQTLHEIGHAVVAKRKGLKVPVIGVAFVVMFPIMYTDATDAWKLTRPKDRLAVGIAGIATDMMMAILATLVWYFMPDGPIRSAAFTVASVSWIMTLVMNVNPLMRFDGYYLISDALGIDNLQERSFAYAKWFMRRMIFGFHNLPPEPVRRWQHWFYLAFSYAVWVYRFFLFLGIALAVYHIFFKALGIVLMMIEIVFFIALPIVRELMYWWKQRQQIRMNFNLACSLVVLTASLAALLVPWQSRIEAPALVRATNETGFYAPVPSRIVEIRAGNGDMVRKGDVIFVLEAPSLDNQADLAALDIQQFSRIIDRASFDPSWRDQLIIASRNLSAAKAQMTGLDESRARLQIRAPFDGMVVDVNSYTHTNRWVAPDFELARLVSPDKILIEGYVRERDLSRISNHSEVRFYSDTPQKPLTGKVVNIDTISQASLDDEILASDFKGGIAARKAERGHYIPNEAVYKILVQVDSPLGGHVQAQRGWLQIEGARVSIATSIAKKAMAIFTREFSLS